MASSVTNVTNALQTQMNTERAARTQSAAQAASTQQPANSQPKSTPSPTSAANTINDTVTISTAATSVMRELTETPGQTMDEANRGDRQAQRLLAQEEAAAKAGQ